MTQPTHDAVMEALARVIDPELHRPITDLGMVSSVDIAEDGVVSVEVLLTVAGCPLKDTITADTRREVSAVEGVTEVHDLHVWDMSPGEPALIGHVQVADLGAWPAVLEAAKAVLREKHGIDHVTLQPEIHNH